MIGYYCSTCKMEHRHYGECLYSYGGDMYDYDRADKRNHTSVSIPSDIRVDETITVYVSGKHITLKRMK